MVHLTDESFVEKILYRLVKKHVSGTTMSSALEKARELNGKNIHASITFLSSGVSSKPKAKYITSTYQELVRQVSRRGLKASVQVPLVQLGLGQDNNAAQENLRDIIGTGNKHGIFIWAELQAGQDFETKEFESCRGFGLALPAESVSDFVKSHKEIRQVKAIFLSDEEGAYGNGIAGDIERVADKANGIVLLSTPQGVVKKLLGGGKSKKSIVFEFRLGDNRKAMKRMMKKGATVSVYLPFGKDWHAYAMNNVPEGYMRFLAGKFLDEREEMSGV